MSDETKRKQIRSRHPVSVIETQRNNLETPTVVIALRLGVSLRLYVRTKSHMDLLGVYVPPYFLQ
jgi:hypothetical protein